MNIIRSILRGFGLILPTGIEAVPAYARKQAAKDQLAIPEIADGVLGVMCQQLNGLNTRVNGLPKLIDRNAWLDTDARRFVW